MTGSSAALAEVCPRPILGRIDSTAVGTFRHLAHEARRTQPVTISPVHQCSLNGAVIWFGFSLSPVRTGRRRSL
jgi:hypothetical protein